MDNVEDLAKMQFLKCREKALSKLLTEQYVEHYRYLMESKSESSDIYVLKLRELFTANVKMRKQRVSYKHYWVTVNPARAEDRETILRLITKYTTRKMVLGAMYTFESRMDDSFHTHILVHQEQYSDSDFRRNTKNSFKKIQAIVDIRSVPEDWVPDKIDYILGKKWDIGKEDYVEYDKTWRIKNSYDSYYTVGSFANSLVGETSVST